ncbi:hypothetical protein CsSME_00003181 [Camellia sinensis var. sinensis]
MKCRDRLHELVKEEIENKDSSTEEWKIVMERSFKRMDNEIYLPRRFTLLMLYPFAGQRLLPVSCTHLGMC